VADQTKTPPSKQTEATYECDRELNVATVNKLEEGSYRSGIDKGMGKKQRGTVKKESTSRRRKKTPVPHGRSFGSAKHSPVVTILAKHLNTAVELAAVTKSAWSQN